MLGKNMIEKTPKDGQNNWERSQRILFNLVLFLKRNLILELFLIFYKHFLNSVSIVSVKRCNEKIYW